MGLEPATTLLMTRWRVAEVEVEVEVATLVYDMDYDDDEVGGGGSGGGGGGSGGLGRGGDKRPRQVREGYGKILYSTAILTVLCEEGDAEIGERVENSGGEAGVRGKLAEGTAPTARRAPTGITTTPIMDNLLADGLCDKPGDDVLEVAFGVYFKRFLIKNPESGSLTLICRTCLTR